MFTLPDGVQSLLQVSGAGDTVPQWQLNYRPHPSGQGTVLTVVMAWTIPSTSHMAAPTCGSAHGQPHRNLQPQSRLDGGTRKKRRSPSTRSRDLRRNMAWRDRQSIPPRFRTHPQNDSCYFTDGGKSGRSPTPEHSVTPVSQSSVASHVDLPRNSEVLVAPGPANDSSLNDTLPAGPSRTAAAAADEQAQPALTSCAPHLTSLGDPHLEDTYPSSECSDDHSCVSSDSEDVTKLQQLSDGRANSVDVPLQPDGEPRFLTENETKESLDAWIKTVTAFLAEDPHFRPFLTTTWLRLSPTDPLRGLRDDSVSTARQKFIVLGALLGRVSRLTKDVLASRSVTHYATSIQSVWQQLYSHFGIYN